jgi:hypothetical protein
MNALRVGQIWDVSLGRSCQISACATTAPNASSVTKAIPFDPAQAYGAPLPTRMPTIHRAMRGVDFQDISRSFAGHRPSSCRVVLAAVKIRLLLLVFLRNVSSMLFLSGSTP